MYKKLQWNLRNYDFYDSHTRMEVELYMCTFIILFSVRCFTRESEMKTIIFSSSSCFPRLLLGARLMQSLKKSITLRDMKIQNAPREVKSFYFALYA